MKCLSLYSGADNLGDGVIQAGHEITLCIEKDTDCCETIKLNHPNIEVINGLVSDNLESLGRFDCVIGGPPCPEFSRAKHNRTFDLCEVNNFLKAREITKSKYHFMENVQDLATVHKEKSFLVNTADYGVPQTRLRRVFTNLKLPKRTHAEFPSESLFGEPVKKWVSVGLALNLKQGFIEDRKTTYFKEDDYRKFSLNTPSYTQITDSRDFFISPTGFNNKNQIEITRSISQPSQTIVISNDYKITDYKIYSTKYLKSKNPTWFKKHPPTELNKPSGTILARDRNNPNEYLKDKHYCRKLINSEMAIIQGFRPDFKFYGNKSSVKRQIGNALPAAISRAFFDFD